METVNAIGRRKAAIARVYVSEGSGKIIVNRQKGTYEVKSGGGEKKPVRLIFQVEDQNK